MRLVRSAGASGEPEALVDVRRRMPGRGAWLHPSPDCLQLAFKRRAIGRALPGATNAGELAAQLAQLSGDGIQSLRTDIVPL
ncbi:YlxR family protein [Arthrobacter sp. STN4]|uniref:YlxR family protein n=1 Tax=Arthrobacter sp. STN4 TaxID=2923276 RepID=UPI002811B46D|nr:YlxR family protein [Arthrobacter sp. STN4]